MNAPRIPAAIDALRAAALALLSVFAAAALPAQDWKGLVDGDLEVRALPVVGTRLGGYGFVLFEVNNRTAAAHAVRCGYETIPYGRGSVEAFRTFVLQPGERLATHLPMPTIVAGHAYLVAQIDGRGTDHLPMENLADDSGLAAVFVAEDFVASAQASGWLASTGAVAVGMRMIEPRHLPPEPTMLSTFDVVVVDVTAALDGAQQDVLRRYAALGGTVVLVRGDRLPPGPLRDLAVEGDGQRVRQGFGAVLPIRSLADMPPKAARRLGFPSVVAGPATGAMHGEVPVPGLGAIPVRGFLVVIIVFAVLVGPVNFFLLRRRRRPELALVTVPATGLAATLLILGYGLFRDGFAIQGVVRSVSVLDQQRHEVAAIASRSLFAGLSPSSLTIPDGGQIECLQALASTARDGLPHRLEFDLERGRVDGALLPSRMTTTIVASQQGPARARLRFRATADGLEVLPDGAFEPLPMGPFVVRTPDGAWWRMDGGRLRRAEAAECLREASRALIASLGEDVKLLDLVRPYDRQYHMVRNANLPGEQAIQAERALDAELPPGTYAGLVRAAPWLGDLGLQVEVLQQHHAVVGRLAEEDVLR